MGLLLPSDNKWFNPLNGHIYRIYVNGKTTWTNAKSVAASTTIDNIPGYLVTITSQKEQDLIRNRVPSNKYWMGLTDEDVEGTWKWVTGTESGTIIRTSSGNVSGQYNNWASNQPDGADYALGNFSGNNWDDDNDDKWTSSGLCC